MHFLSETVRVTQRSVLVGVASALALALALSPAQAAVIDGAETAVRPEADEAQGAALLRTAPNALLTIDQNRSTVVARIVDEWEPELAAGTSGITAEALRATLSGMRADYLLAASLAGSFEGLRQVVASAQVSSAPTSHKGVTAKALGDAAADLVYTPVVPCRIVDSRNVGGTFGGGENRGYHAFLTSGTFAAQGGTASTCGVPANPAAVALNLTVVSGGASGYLTAWPYNVAQPGASTLNYAPGQVVANGAIIPLCQGVCTFDFSVVASGVDLIVDIVGYFKAPGGSLGTVTNVAAGTGLSGGPITTTGTIAADTTYLQRRVSASCAVGQYIRVIAVDGTVTCGTDANSGTVTNVGTGTGLTGGPIIATGTIGIANGGVGSTQLADNSVVTAKVADANVTTAKLADANVTKAKLAATGGAAGQILGTDGTTLQWTAAPATLTPINPLGNSITTVDSVGNVGQFTAITLGADGLPVVSYYDVTNHALKVAKCANAACTGASTITTVDNTANMGEFYSSITLGTDGLPVISYFDGTNLHLKVAKCANAACTGASTITTVDGTQIVGQYPSLTLGADGLPVISYWDYTNLDLKVAKCANAACTGVSTITTVDSAGNVGRSTSIMLGADGLPVISYFDGANYDLKVAKCANAACTGASTITTVDSTGNVGFSTSIALGADGLPVISYSDLTNGDLKVAKCANAACTGTSTITTVDSLGSVGDYTSITLGADGLPVIGYYDATNHGLKVARCANAACTGASAITTVDSTGSVGQYPSITLGADGLPVISYYDSANGDLMVAKCSSQTCVPYVRRR